MYIHNPVSSFSFVVIAFFLNPTGARELTDLNVYSLLEANQFVYPIFKATLNTYPSFFPT